MTDVARLGQLLAVLVSHTDDPRALVDTVLWKLAELFLSDIVALDVPDASANGGRATVCIGLGDDTGSTELDPDGVLAAATAGGSVTWDGSAPLPSLSALGVQAAVHIALPEAARVLSLYRCRPGPFSAHEVELLTVMGRHLSLVLRSAWRLTQLARLAEHSLEAGACRDQEQVLGLAVEGAVRLLEADAAVLALIEDGVLREAAHQGLDGPPPRWDLPVGELWAFPAVRDRRPHSTCDVGRAGGRAEAGAGMRAAVAAPLEIDGAVVGLLYVYRRSDRPFTAEDTDVLTLLAGQVAAGMANARLIDAAERRHAGAESLRHLSSTLNGTLDPAAVVKHVCAAMLEHSGADRVSVLLLDEAAVTLSLLCTQGTDADAFRFRLATVLPGVPVAQVRQLAAAVLGGRAHGRAVATITALLEGHIERRTATVLPMLAHNEPIGVIVLEHLSDPIGAGASAEAVTVAAMAAVALGQARLFQRIERDRRQLVALHDVAVAISGDEDVDTMLERICVAAQHLTGAANAEVVLAGEGGGRAHRVGTAGQGGGAPATVWLGSLGAGLNRWVLQRAQSGWLIDASGPVTEPAEIAHALEGKADGCAVAAPILGRGGRSLGVLALHHPRPHFFTRSSVDLLERFAAEATLVVENRQDLDARRTLEAQLRREASHDQLTGLANRSRLLAAIEAALARGTGVRRPTVLFLDLDRFKAVNDTLGHAAGDQLLTEVAQRLTRAVRQDDVVARLGGDEFVVLLDPGEDEATSHAVSTRVLRELAQPMTVSGQAIFLTASIGVTTAHDLHRGAGDLLRDADIAMYRSKAGGRGRVTTFTPAMTADNRLSLEGDLRHALADGLLDVHYQPIVELDTASVVGAEALVRWQHPRLGAVSPDQFVTLAEETGLVDQLDRYVLRRSLRDLQSLRGQGGQPLNINVNLSAVHLHEAELPRQVAQALRESGVDAARLTMEITETAAMRDPAATLRSLSVLTALGLGIAIDDFGTGYSNLGYLKRFPLKGLKIDRSFVENVDTDVHDAAIVAAVLTLSHSLGLQVTAEGIETVAQQQRLLQLGCRQAQGYLFSKPLPLSGLQELLGTGGDEQRSPGATAVRRTA